jgi:hypothetical protein
MSPTKFLLGVTTIAALMGLGRSAAAQTCTTDKDCPQSFTCVDSGVSTEPAPAPTCPPGTVCPKPPASTTPATVNKYCQPKACTADANCGPGMVCHTQSYTQCSGGAAVAACPPNTACDPAPKPAPTDCVTKTVSACAFKWQLPCNASADCGDGFTCKPNVTGCANGSSGSTGSGTASSSGGGAPTPGTGATPVAADPPDFAPRKPADADGGTAPGCPPVMETFPGYCAPTATTCAKDTDCPASWKCTQYNLPGTSSSRPASPPSDGGASSGGASTGGTSTGAPAPVSTPAPVDAGAPMTVRECTSPYGGVRGDTASASGSGGPLSPQPQTGSGNPPPSGGGTKTSAESASSGGGACSLNPAGGTSASGLALAALLGVLIARRRK